MLKSLKYLIVSGLSLIILSACNGKEEPDNTSKQDDAYYAAKATISSSDSHFTATADGGAISFKSEGGSVNIIVDCGTEWTVENDATDLFEATVNNIASLKITAGQNTVTHELSATVTLYTAADRVKFATIAITQNAYDAPEITAETTTWNVPAVGDLTTEINVNSTVGDWAAECSASWITVSKTDSSVSLEATENENTEERTASVVLSTTDGISIDREIITVIQDAKAYVTPDKATLGFYEKGETSSTTVDSNFDWDYSYDSSNGWVTVSRDGNTLTATVTADYNVENESREVVVTLTASDGAQNTADFALVITEFGPQANALIIEYTLTDDATKIQLPLTANVDCTVDWRDGSEIQIVTSAVPSHTYAKAGVYEVRINGSVGTIDNNIVDKSSRILITKVVQWGNVGLTSMSKAFANCTALTAIPDDTEGAFSDVTLFEYAFYNCPALTEIPSGLFTYCSKATTFESAFYKDVGITTLPGGLFANCSAAKTFDYAFSYCPIVELPTGFFDGCTSAQSFKYVFFDCTALKTIPSGLFDDCTKATTFQGCFNTCSALSSIPEGLFDKCTAVVSFQSCFYGCKSVKTIPTGLFDNNTETDSFYSTFYNCSDIEAIPQGLFDKNTKVTDFRFALYGCSSITEIPEGLFDNCPLVTSFSCLFYNCSSLKTVPAGLFDKCPLNTSVHSMFSGCTSLEYIPDGLFDKQTQLTDMYALFYNCSSLESIPDGLCDNCPLITDFSFAFYGCKAIKSIPKGLFDKTPLVTTFYAVFYNCTALEEIPAGLFDNCSLATDFEFSFYKCETLKELPKGLFDNCPSITTFATAFYKCLALTTLPEGLFSKQPNVTTFEGLVYGCTNLTSVPEDLFSNNTKVTVFTNTFYQCTALTGESPYSTVNGSKVHIYERTSSNGFSTVRSYSQCFTDCTGLTDYGKIPSGWGGGSSTSSVSSYSATEAYETSFEDPGVPLPEVLPVI